MPSSHPSLAPLSGQRILVTGGQGMLGGSFARQLARHLPTAVVWAPGHAELDVCNAASMRAAHAFQPQLILHCAAKVDADFCETDAAFAEASIVGGTQQVVDLALATGARLMYPQSFLIHDGEDDPITEATPPRPLCEYGRQKVAAERLVLDRIPGALVVRMAGFFGGGAADTNFVGKVVPHIAKLLAAGQASIEIGDRVWQPTFTDDLAFNTLVLAAQDRTGVYCMACHGHASFYSLTCEIVRLLSLDDRFTVNRVDAQILAGREKARRPLRAVMANQRLQTEGLDLQRPWQDALADYLRLPHFRNLFT